MKKLSLVLCVFFLIIGCKAQEDTLTQSCQQFIQDLAFNSPYLEYESCEYQDSDYAPLTLSYRIKGEYTEQIENYLIERSQLSHSRYKFTGLRKPISVAGWEGRGYLYDVYNVKDNIYILFGFYSDDTFVDKRENWKDIPYFYLYFSKYENAW